MPNCQNAPKDPSCYCYDLNEFTYRSYDEATKTYYCCEKPPFPIINDSTGKPKSYSGQTVDNYFTDLINNSETQKTGCLTFFQNINQEAKSDVKGADDYLMTNYPELYYQLLVQKNLNPYIYPITRPDGSNSYLIGCSDTNMRPVWFQYNDDNFTTIEYVYGCTTLKTGDDLPEDIHLNIINFRDKNGNTCLTNTCDLGVDPDNPLSRGTVAFETKYNAYTKHTKLSTIETIIVSLILVIIIGLMIWWMYKTENLRGKMKNPDLKN